MYLDLVFGTAVAPQAHGLRVGEETLSPLSLVVCSSMEAGDLSGTLHFMAAVQNGCRVSSFHCKSASVLWIIDYHGYLRVAVEEAFLVSNPDTRIPFITNLRVSLPQGGWNKLGHPALLEGDKFGRIAGEAVYDEEEQAWELNNLSGRYGLGLDRSEEHLENVAELLRKQGLKIIVDFNRPRV